MTENGDSSAGVAPQGSGDADDNTLSLGEACLSALGESIRKVRDDVLPRIVEHATNHEEASELDLLHVKNGAMVTYLIELVAQVRHEAATETETTDIGVAATASSGPNVRRLMEVKAVIDKTRNLEQKLRYQIDKLLAAASEPQDDEEVAVDDEPKSSGSNGRAASTYRTDDPLEYRPNVGALLGDEDEEDDGASSADGDRDDPDASSDDDDEEIAAARRTLALAGKGTMAKKSTKPQSGDDEDRRKRTTGVSASAAENVGASTGPELYRAPRLASVPYAADDVDKRAEMAKRERQKLRAGEVATALRSRYSDAPDVEDLHGGADLGRQREASRRLAERQTERTHYEESNMVRLTETRKDKKLKKRLMRQEMSNLSAIADLGSLVVRGLGSKGVGGGSDDDDDDLDGRRRRGKASRSSFSNGDEGNDGQRYQNGKRRRSAEGGGGGGGGGKKTSFQSSNSLQAALFGGQGSGGKKKKRGGAR